MKKFIKLLTATLLCTGGIILPGLVQADHPGNENHAKLSESGEYVQQSRPLAIVRRFNPLVAVRHLENDEWIHAERTHQLRDADTLRTDDDGFAVVQFMDNSVARVRPNSMLIVNGEVRAPDNISSRIAVEVGDMFLNISGVNSAFEVATPSAVASVRGTEFTTLVDVDGNSVFTGFSGEVEIMALTSGQLVTLTRGIRASVDSEGEEITLTDISDDELNRQFANYDDTDRPPDTNIMRLRFINEEGEVEVIELEYYEIDSDND